MRGHLGPYEILAPIGAGGMGEVYRARDRRLSRLVAIKVLTPSHLERPDARSRFDREARAIAALDHPHICPLYDIGHDDGTDFLVMPYLEGETLASRLGRGALPIPDALRYASEIAEAIDAAHQQGITHRDLKPSNIMLTKSGAVLLDFGLAKLSASHILDQSASGTTITELSRDGVIAGTVRYMAPEVLDGKPADPRSDIFSFGAVVYEMLTGKRAFSGDSEARVIAAILHEDPPALTTVRADVPRELDAIVRTCLAKNPQDRWQNAGDVVKQLKQIGGVTSAIDSPVERPPDRDLVSSTRVHPKPPATPVPVTTAWWRRLAAAGAVLIAVALTVVVRWPRSAAPSEPALFAVLPPANPTADPIAEQLGTAMASIVSDNLRRRAGLKVVSREATAAYAASRADLGRITSEVGATYVCDLTVRNSAQAVDVIARIWRRGSSVAVLDTPLAGNAIDVQRRLLDAIGGVLDSSDVGSPARSRERPGPKLPTADADAFMAYIEALALLDRKEESGASSRAIALLERATAADSQFALAHAALANAFVGRFMTARDAALLQRADSAARRALQLDPDASAAHTAFAAVQNQSGKRDAAATALHRAIDLGPDNDEAHRLLGEIMAARGSVDAGVAEIRTAVRIRPSFASYYSLGFVLYIASRFAAALEAFEKAAELRPTDGGTYEMLGATHQLLGHLDQAIGNYEHAIRVGPTAMAFANLGMLYFEAGSYDKARGAVLAAIARNPKKASAYRSLGDICLKLQRTAEARAAYEKAITMAQADLVVNATDPFPIVLIAICEANLGRRHQAERHAGEAFALAPSNRDVLYRVGKVYALTGDRPAAMKALRGAIEHGYDRDAARRDPELASLRSLPEFDKLLSEEVQR